MPKLDASSVPMIEIEMLEQTRDKLPEGNLRSTLETLSHALRDGEDMFVIKPHETLTPSEAAGLLGVSRTHLYKILDSGAIPHHIVGSRDRRIAATDLLAYRARMLESQQQIATNYAHADQGDDLALDEFD